MHIFRILSTNYKTVQERKGIIEGPLQFAQITLSILEETQSDPQTRPKLLGGAGDAVPPSAGKQAPPLVVDGRNIHPLPCAGIWIR